MKDAYQTYPIRAVGYQVADQFIEIDVSYIQAGYKRLYIVWTNFRHTQELSN
jgi:hypothetical protein